MCLLKKRADVTKAMDKIHQFTKIDVTFGHSKTLKLTVSMGDQNTHLMTTALSEQNLASPWSARYIK